jgi:hypothetical protein
MADPIKMEMADHFDSIPVPYRTERLGRLRDLIIQIEADYKRYKHLKQKIEAGIGVNSEMEELHRREAWIKRNVNVFRRLNAMSIEGVTCAGIGGLSASSYQRM